MAIFNLIELMSEPGRGKFQPKTRNKQGHNQHHRSAMRFLGMEIDREENGEFKIHQTSYTMELLERHKIETKTLAIRVPEEPQSEEVTADAVKRAQGLTGELQWLAGKTRPDITCAVTKMAQNTTKKPEWACRLGEAILHYLNGTVDAGLVYGEVIAESDDPEMLRRCPRTSGTIEVMTDASFAAGDGHSVTGLVILYGGAPIQWETTKKQGLIALSTAEAELTSLLEGLQRGRAARSLINLIEDTTVMELLNDNRAALILASNQGGGWRTRHLRIRANCLAEAVDTKEVDLQHRVGTKLWADSLTKVLAAPSLQRFKEGIGLRSSSDEVLVGGPKVKVSKVLGLNEDIKDRLLKALLILLVACATMDDVKAATGKEMDMDSPEVPKGAEPEFSGQLVCLLLGLGAMVIYKLIGEVGMAVIRRIVAGGETQPELKVKLLDEKAVGPSRGSDEAGDVQRLRPSTWREPFGVYRHCFAGSQGDLWPRSSLASRGIDIGGGVVDGDYRGEIKVILYNRGEEQMKFAAGDRVAQIILEKYEGVPVKRVEELSESQRGSKGFGSSGKKIHLKVLRGCSVESSSEGECSWSFINESEELENCAAVLSSGEDLMVPMAADEPTFDAVDAAEQSNERGARDATTVVAGDGREPDEMGARETSEYPDVEIEASGRNPEASWRDGDHADERDGREGREEALAEAPSDVTYVQESFREIDEEGVDAAAGDIAEINYEVRRNVRVVSANNDFVLLKKGPVPARPVFVAVGSSAKSHGMQGLEGMQNLSKIMAIRDQYEAALKSCGYAVTYDRDQRGSHGEPASEGDLAIFRGLKGRTVEVKQGHPVMIFCGNSSDHGACQSGRHEELVHYEPYTEINVSQSLLWQDDQRARDEWQGKYTQEEIEKWHKYKEKEEAKRQRKRQRKIDAREKEWQEWESQQAAEKRREYHLKK